MTTENANMAGAYNSQQEVILNDREIDARALLRCAGRLQLAMDNKEDMNEVAAAVRHNQRLWTIFQVSLCDPENGLPSDLKATLLSLSHYIDRISYKAVVQYEPKLLTSLIDINRIIATGLLKKQEAAASMPQAAGYVTAQAPAQAPAAIMTSA